MQSTTATFDQITQFMSEVDMDDVFDLEEEMNALAGESEGSPVETVQRAIRALEQVDSGMVKMFGNEEQLQKAEDRLRDLLALMERGEEAAVAAALRASYQEDHDFVERMPTWELIYPSESDENKEYVVTWDVGSKWHPSGQVPEYGCTCKSFQYKTTGKRCKHIEAVIDKHGGGGAVPPNANHTGSVAVLHSSKYKAGQKEEGELPD
jgi:uncharacterized protein YoaH (UPF0181 family)